MRPSEFWVLALLSAATVNNVFADPWSGHVGSLLAKRQDLATCNSGIEDTCNEGPDQCVEAICAACSGYKQIADCCGITSTYLGLQCILNSMQNPSTETVASSSSIGGLLMSITSNASIPTSVPVSVAMQACSQVESIVKSCEGQHLINTAMSFSNDTHCVCYSSGTYNSSRYDEPYSNCMAYLSTASPELYAKYTAPHTSGVNLSPCSSHVNASVTSTTSSKSTWYIGYTTEAGQSPVQPSGVAQVSQVSSSISSPTTISTNSAMSSANMQASGVLVLFVSSILLTLNT